MPAIDAVFGSKPRQEGHEHSRTSGSEARDAQTCSSQLYRTILSAIELQRKWDERGIKLLATVETEGETPARGADIPEEESTNEILEAWDDAIGEDLDPATVLAARREEITYYKAMERSRRFQYRSASPGRDASQSEFGGETSTTEICATSTFAVDWWQRTSTTKNAMTCLLGHYLWKQ